MSSPAANDAFEADLLAGPGCDPGPRYAVEAVLAGRELVIEQAVVFPAPAELDRVVLRVFPNGVRRWKDNVQISVARVNGANVTPQLTGTLLTLPVVVPVEAGEPVQVEISLRQPIPDIPEFTDDPTAEDFPDRVTAEHTGAFGIGYGVINLGYWLPQLTWVDGAWDERELPVNGEHTFFEPATWYVTLDTPSDFVVATTGSLDTEVVVGGRRRGSYRAHGVREFAASMSPRFKLRRRVVDGIELRVFYFTDAAVADAMLAEAAQSLAFYNDVFGPYRYRELDIVEAPVSVALGTEYSGLVTVDSRKGMLEWTVAHEVAHQWWYGDVHNDSRDAPWVDEALTAASAALYWRHQYGDHRIDGTLQDEADAWPALVEAGIQDLPVNLPGSSYDLLQYGILVYGRGGLFYELVRQSEGTAALLESLRSYRAANVCGIVDESVLLDALEPLGARPLFDAWIATPGGHPDVGRANR